MCHRLERVHWPGSYGRRHILKRLWNRIPAPDFGCTFSQIVVNFFNQLVPIERCIYLLYNVPTFWTMYLPFEQCTYLLTDVPTYWKMYRPIEWFTYLYFDIPTYFVMFLPIVWCTYLMNAAPTYVTLFSAPPKACCARSNYGYRVLLRWLLKSLTLM